MWRARFDARGNKIEMSLFGADGRPCPHAMGVATYKWKYDDRGNDIERVSLGMDGNPVLHKIGRYATRRAKYDQHGNKIEQAYFGVDGKPCLYKDWFASWSEKRDESGNFVKRIYLDIQGRPIRTTEAKHVMNQNAVVTVSTLPDSPAAQKGIQQGDILLEFEDWTFFPQRRLDRSMGDLLHTMDQADGAEVVVFRPALSSAIQFLFEPGGGGADPVGLEIEDSLWTGEDLKGIQEAYEKFVLEKTTGRNER